MAEIAQDRPAKATERERKFRASSVQAKEIAVRVLKQERKCRICTNFVMVFFFFFFLVMLFSCFDSSENVGMMRLSLADELKYKLVLYCNRTMKEFCCWCWCNRTMKPLNNITFLKIKCYLC